VTILGDIMEETSSAPSSHAAEGQTEHSTAEAKDTKGTGMKIAIF
jgi:hypothetical protein